MKLNKAHPLYKQDLRNILSVNRCEELRNRTLLITGATGMVGTMLADAMMELGDVNVIAVGRNAEKAKSRLGEYFGSKNFIFAEQDVRTSFSTEFTPDYIIPLASNTHPLAYSQYPVETLLINIKGAENALNLAAQCNATVLYPSTVDVYGNAISDKPFKEDSLGYLSLQSSRSCYNESKRASEALCQSYLAEKGVSVKIGRLCRLFGPTMLPDDSKASSQFIKKAIEKENIVLKSDGKQFFSYTYIADAVAALLHIMLSGDNGKAYNISSRKTDIHLRDFAGICAQKAGTSVVFEVPDEKERKGYSLSEYSVLDNSALRQSGFEPKYEIEDAIERTIRILTEN